MECKYCDKQAEKDTDLCFRHRVMSVGVSWKAGAVVGRKGWNITKNDHMLEHFGTTDDRELGKRGIERAS